MAKTGDTDDAFVREVDEEYRRDQLKSLWARYGRWLLTAIVVGLVALGGLLYWREARGRAAGAEGEQFNLALAKVETGDFAAAAPVFAALGKSDHAGYRALSQLMLAANAAQTGDTAKALALYKAVERDATLARPFRDLALVRATRLEFDTLPPAATIAALRPLSIPGSPWFGVAGEMTGIAYLKSGKPELAEPLFRAVAADANVAPSLRSRAAQLASAMGRVPAPAPRPAVPATVVKAS